jgi:hypothetical protein
MENIFIIVELLCETQKRRKGKESDTASIISKNITSVKAEDIRICIESC